MSNNVAQPNCWLIAERSEGEDWFYHPHDPSMLAFGIEAVMGDIPHDTEAEITEDISEDDNTGSAETSDTGLAVSLTEDRVTVTLAPVPKRQQGRHRPEMARRVERVTDYFHDIVNFSFSSYEGVRRLSTGYNHRYLFFARSAQNRGNSGEGVYVLRRFKEGEWLCDYLGVWHEGLVPGEYSLYDSDRGTGGSTLVADTRTGFGGGPNEADDDFNNIKLKWNVDRSCWGWIVTVDIEVGLECLGWYGPSFWEVDPDMQFISSLP